VTVWDGLLLDCRAVRPDAVIEQVVTEHSEVRADLGDVLGPLVVPDDVLGRVDRVVGSLGVGPVPVAVICSTGAGGVVALAGRECDDLELVAASSTLRDLDDLAGNAARVVAAARTLPETITVHVGLPATPGWQAAAEVVEAAGLSADVGADVDQWSLLVELDLPFVVSDPSLAVGDVIRTVHRLVEGDDGAGPVDPTRIRRRLRGLWTTDPLRSARELARWLEATGG